MYQLEAIKELIANGEIDTALQHLESYLNADAPNKDVAYYLRGNAYRKQGNWQQALNNYQWAIDLNPESPAADARQMVINILNFFNKDMYNQ